MNAYLVYTDTYAEDGITIKGKALVGFFAARTPEELADIVDEFTDPFTCYYTKLKRGFGCFFPIDSPRLDENNELIEHGIEWSECATNAIYSFFEKDKSQRWVGLGDAAERCFYSGWEELRKS